MIRRHCAGLLFFLSLVFLTVFTFRLYFFKGLVPFPSNLLVTFFAPWNTMQFPGWEHGIPNKPMGIDNLNLFYPYKNLSIDLVKRGIVPLWNPYNFSGNVLLANLQSSALYPLNILYFLLPGIDAWSWTVIIQPILAGLFTYLFLRSLFLSKPTAAFGALVFAFSGEMIVWMSDHLVVSHTMLWLPCILWSIERFLTSRKWYFYLIAIISLTFSFFAGFFQPFFYVFVTGFLYMVYRLFQRSSKIISPTYIFISLMIFPISIGFSAIQLLPSLEALMLSPRNSANVGYLYDTFLMPVRHLVSFLMPDYLGNPGAYNFFGKGAYHESVLFIGIIPLVFALIGLMQWKTRQIVRFFSVMAGITLLLGLNFPFIRALYDLKIPIFYTFLPSRIFFLTTFALSVLAAVGLEEWTEYKNIQIPIGILTGFLIVLICLKFNPSLLRSFTGEQKQIIQKNLLVPLLTTLAALGFFLSAKIFQKKSVALYGLFLLTIVGQQYFAQKYLFFSYRQFTYPAHPIFDFMKTYAGNYRFWTYGDGYINANFATYYRVFSPDGTDALFSSRLGELFYATETKGKLTGTIPRIDVRIARANEGDRMTDNRERLRLLSLVGVKYVTDWTKTPETTESQNEKFPPQLFTHVWKQDWWNIYELKTVLPRAFLTNQFMVEKNPQRILDGIFDPSRNLNEIILEEKPPLTLENTPLFKETPMSLVSPNFININVQTDKDALLFLSDTYFPGWHAYVDGTPSKIYRANYAFRAVLVPAGAKTVHFVYKPESFQWGLWISSLSFVLVIMTGIILTKLNHQHYRGG